MGEAVVVLLPDVRGEQIVQRGDLAPPRQFERHLQPFGVLAEHRIDDADEGFVAVEQPVPAGQQIALEPALALVLAEHRIEHAAGGREELVVLDRPRIPLAIGDLEDGAQEVRQRLVGAEDAEIPLLLVQLDDVAQELAEHHRVLGVDGAGRRHVDRMDAEVGHLQIAQQQAAIGVRIGAHAPVALRRQLGQLGDQPPAVVEQLLGPVALHPAFELLRRARDARRSTSSGT